MPAVRGAGWSAQTAREGWLEAPMRRKTTKRAEVEIPAASQEAPQWGAPRMKGRRGSDCHVWEKTTTK